MQRGFFGKKSKWVKALTAFAFFLFSETAHGEFEDFFLTQRVGLTESRGSLAKEYRRLGLQTSMSRSFKSYPWGVAFDFAHEFTFYTDSFLTRGEDNLYFPLNPHARATLLEPALGFDLCTFTMSIVRLCTGGGLSLVHLKTSADNFQMYVGTPVGIRLVYVPETSFVVWEIGTRYRSIQNKVAGFVNQHEDLFTYVSVGVAAIQSR